jgi:hypothetical protein
VKASTRYFTPLLAAVALGGAVAAAPEAMATTAIPHPSPSVVAPPPPGDASDPLVPSDIGANPFVFVPRADELPG